MKFIVGVMESKTGKGAELWQVQNATIPHISGQKDIPALNPKFSEYPYEAGSVLKPITLAMATGSWLWSHPIQSVQYLWWKNEDR